MNDERFLGGVCAVVTGASSGIGKAIAAALARAGAVVALAARRADRLAAFAAEIEAAGGSRALPVATDVANEDEVVALMAAARRELGPIAILVNAAGQGLATPVASLATADLDRVMAVNFRAAVLCTREALPDMLARRSGAVVNVGSISSRVGWANGSAYVASKFALRGFALCLWKEVHAQGVRVVNVYPGAVSTEIYAAAGSAGAAGRGALAADDVAAAVVDALRLPARANVVELDLWPTDLR